MAKEKEKEKSKEQEQEGVQVEQKPEEPKGPETQEVELNPEEEREKKIKELEQQLEKERNRAGYLERQQKKRDRELQEFRTEIQNLKGAVTQPKQEQSAEAKPDDLDEIAQRDWKEAVRRLGREEAERTLRETQQQTQQQQQQQHRAQILEASRQRVAERFPMLAKDEPSEEADYFLRARNELLQEDTSFLQNPYAPEITEKRMIDLMQREGKTPSGMNQQIQEKTQEELERQKRVGAMSQPQGSTPSKETIQLTSDEIKVAKELGIPLEQYARIYKMGDDAARQGVSVNE